MTQQHELLDAAIKKIGNRYLATMLVAKRMRQLYHGAPPYVVQEEDESLFAVALREITGGHLVLQKHPLTDIDPSIATSAPAAVVTTETSQPTDLPAETIPE